MRLWHKNLIGVLPRQQLVGSWRELSSIATNIKSKGTPNHILINKIMNYDLDHFITYAKLVRAEMTRRGYKTMDSVWNKIVSVKPDWNEVAFEGLYEGWHNHRYYNQCYYNLEEKFDCGGITTAEWQLIMLNTTAYLANSSVLK